MNTYEFFNENFGHHLVDQSGEPWDAAHRCLSASHKLAKGTTGRLGSGWAIVKAGKGIVQLKLAADGLVYDDRTRYEAFLDELENWTGEPVMLLVFDKKPLSISNLFITADLRAVRICTPAGVQTFDWTEPPEKSAPSYHSIMYKQQEKKKNAA
jgi:hypothetical protein